MNDLEEILLEVREKYPALTAGAYAKKG